MLPICTWTVLMGQVLADSCTLGVDMMNLSLSLHFFSESVPKVTRDSLCYRKDVLQFCPIDLIESPARLSSEENRFTTRSRARE